MTSPRRQRPFVERRGDRWRVRWPDGSGDIRSASRDDDGRPFLTKDAAEAYGWEQIRKIGRGDWLDPRRSGITLEEWVNDWWVINRIDELAHGSTARYRNDVQTHVLPTLGAFTLAELAEADVALAKWETKQREEYAPNTVDNRRNLLSTILSDAVVMNRMPRNPLKRSNRRGRKAKRATETAEKVWLTPLQTLLVAERAAVYARGNVTAFVMVIVLAYTGMRSRELVGLERRHIDICERRLDVQWQLAERKGGVRRERPKHDSRRTIDLPGFLADLLDVEMRRHDGRCDCSTHPVGPYFLGPGPKTAHINSRTTNTWFHAAACGTYYSKPVDAYLPVPVIAGPFVGEPTAGRRAEDACWVPIADGATPHSLRHSHRVWMDDAGTPDVLMHERLGHQMRGIAATYSHVSTDAREALCRALADWWEQSLRQRATFHPRSPVPLLDGLLRPYREGGSEVLCSQSAPTVAEIRPGARRAG